MVQLQHILVPVDFSDRALTALRYAVGLARDVGGLVDVLHVWEPPSYVVPDMVLTVSEGTAEQTVADLARREITHEMERLLSHLEEDRRYVGEELLEMGGVQDAIRRVLHDHHYDLVVIATHGRRGLSRLVLGSVAEGVVRSVSCPVLTVHAAEAPEHTPSPATPAYLH